MVRKIDHKMIVRELSISFLQSCGSRNKTLEWIVKFAKKIPGGAAAPILPAPMIS